MTIASSPCPRDFGERFLRVPDRFPSRPGGDRWGNGRVDIAFAGGRYGVTGLDPRQEQAVRQRFGEFVSNGGVASGAPIPLELVRIPADDFLPIPPAGGTFEFDTDYQETRLRLAGECFMARVDLGSLATAIWFADPDALIANAVLENCLRLLEAYRLLGLGGVLLHCAGVVDRGRAHLFLGPSGAGKSTLSRAALAVGKGVLSDDMNTLAPVNGEVMALRLPFAGELGQTATQGRYPVCVLCRLRQGPANAVVPASPGMILGALVGCAPFVNADPYRLERLMANLSTLVGRFPAFILTFTRDGDFWPQLEEALR